MKILSPEMSAQVRRQRVYLIGLRGAGKSTLGRMVSEALYKSAEATVNTSGKSLPECRAELVRAVREVGVA